MLYYSHGTIYYFVINFSKWIVKCVEIKSNIYGFVFQKSSWLFRMALCAIYFFPCYYGSPGIIQYIYMYKCICESRCLAQQFVFTDLLKFNWNSHLTSSSIFIVGRNQSDQSYKSFPPAKPIPANHIHTMYHTVIPE